MDWTKQVPTEDGRYWVRDSTGYSTIVRIIEGELLRFGRVGLNRSPDYYEGKWWYGPIQPPPFEKEEA